MGIRGPDWLRKLFGLDMMTDEEKQQALAIQEKKTELAVRELAYEICIKRIAKAICKCEFRTYKKGSEYKGDLYYMLNICPNANQNATEFWEKLIHRLYTDMEAVIVPWTEGDTITSIYVADSFNLDDTQAINEWTFKDIMINGMRLSSRKSSDVFYFKLQDERVKRLLASTLSLYQDLISTAYKSYKNSNGTKVKMKIDRAMENNAEEIEEIINDDVAEFLGNADAVFPEYEGYTLDRFDTGGTVQTTRDLKALIDDVLEMTCKALLIPTNIMTGEVTDTSKAVDDFLTFCLDSLVELIQDELNRKIYGKKYLKGDFLKINTQTIKHIDILDMAGAIDKLLASGVKSINDINRVLGDEPINEPWADKHYMTKNYVPMEEMLNSLGEGKEKEEPT